MRTGITLITMGAGNVIVLKETLESFKHVCDEIIYGDLLLFAEDREIVRTYQEEYNLKFVKLPFNYIFKNGFSATLNELAFHATNDLVIYMNTSEVIEKDNGILQSVSPEYNCYYFDHATDPHRWYRMYNRHELKWSGVIHEQLVGEHRPYYKPIFRMADLEKDMHDKFKARVLNATKELVYFQQYVNIVDNPELLGETNEGWLNFARADYDSFQERLHKNPALYQGMVEGDMHKYLSGVYGNKEFDETIFESSEKIEYQGDPKFLGK
jgi:hypothetical protein